MPTLTLTDLAQDGSLCPDWIHVDYEPDTQVVVSSYGQLGHGMADGLTQTINNRLLTIDDFDGFYSVTDAQAEFEHLASEWKRETAHLSSLTMIVEHHAYQEIIGMGKEAIPMILRDLTGPQAQWFWALRAITRESPVRPEDRGDIEAMTVAWLDWGKNRRYI